MKNNRPNSRRLAYTFCLLSLLAGLLLTGCTPTAASSPTPRPSDSPKPTDTATPTATLTATPTAIPEPTATATNTPAPTLTRTPEPKPQPSVLSKQAAATAIYSLYETNGDCRLPCFWGITPGVTTWADAEQILVPLRATIMTEGSEKHLSLDQSIYISDINQLDFTITNGRVSAINVVQMSFKYKYKMGKISSLLSQYGEPSEVKIFTLKKAPGGSPAFRVSIYYAEAGILATYDTSGWYHGGKVEACFNPQSKDAHSTFHSLNLFSVDSPVNMTEAIQAGKLVESTLPRNRFRDFLPIDQATGMSVKEFYEKYKSDRGEACIVTPADLWP
jgi:hypothetical protein